MVNTPVLYITFARPEYANQSFAAIKKAQPRKLYFYSNKAREDKPEEVKRNEEVRLLVKQIDWDCEVKTWFREEYVDVFTSIHGAIDWIFDNEEEAIIIEEDVVTSFAFFDYMDKLIPQYRNDNSIWIISGNNGAPQFSPDEVDFFPARLADIYGWGSWKKVWKQVDWEMCDWEKKFKRKQLKTYFDNYLMYLYCYVHYNRFYKKIKTTNFRPWDMLFNYSMRMNFGYCINPSVNLAKDIGVVGENHTKGDDGLLGEIGFKNNIFLKDVKKELPPLSSFDWLYFSRVVIPAKIKRIIKR